MPPRDEKSDNEHCCEEEPDALGVPEVHERRADPLPDESHVPSERGTLPEQVMRIARVAEPPPDVDQREWNGVQ